MKLDRITAADGAGVRIYWPELQLHSIEYVRINPVHRHISLIEALQVHVKGVRIFHDEFASTQKPKSWTSFVAKFSLYLVKINR